MISKKPDKDLFLLQEKDLRLIPRSENIDEIGFACVTAESLDDGNILVYVSIQFMDEGERVTHETLSVVKDNLQTVHEKSVLRTYVGGCLTVPDPFRNRVNSLDDLCLFVGKNVAHFH